MNKLLFYILIAAGLITWLCGCVTVDKAINKVASTEKFTPNQENLLAAKFNIMFPVKDFTVIGEKVTDSTEYKKKLAEMQAALESNTNDLINLLKLIDSTGGENEKLNSIAATLRARIDSATIALTLAKLGKIPCPKIMQTDTAFKRATADITVLENKLNDCKIESATKDVELSSASEKIKSLENQVNELKAADNRWKYRRQGAIAAAIVLIGAGIFLKLKSII